MRGDRAKSSYIRSAIRRIGIMSILKTGVSVLMALLLTAGFSNRVISEETAGYYFNQGNTHYKQRLYDQAISDYSKAIGINPVYAGAYNNRGNAYAGKGLQDQAISDYNKAIEINPKLAEAYYYRGYAHYNKGEYTKAAEDEQKAQDLGFQIDPG